MEDKVNLFGNLHDVFISGVCEYKKGRSEGGGRTQGKYACRPVHTETQRDGNSS